MFRKVITALVLFLLTACSAGSPQNTASTTGLPRVLAVETFLADIVRNITADRLVVDSLLPINSDPHSYQPSPGDIKKVSISNVLVINGAGLETFITPLLENADGTRLVITASDGLIPISGSGDGHPEVDPHFWMDPNNVIRYVENIRDGLIQADPQGQKLYTDNAAAYISQLILLDTWITDQVAQIPTGNRLLVTNHDSLAYFAARYGFTVIGSIIPSVSSESVPTASQLTGLIDQIRATGARAIFIETGANKQLAEQISAETNVKLVTDLFTASLSSQNGPSPTYIDMMKYNVDQIVNALK